MIFEVIISSYGVVRNVCNAVGEWHKHGRASDDSIAPLSSLIRREQLARLQCA